MRQLARRAFRSVRVRLVGLVLAAAVPAALVNIGLLWRAYRVGMQRGDGSAPGTLFWSAGLLAMALVAGGAIVVVGADLAVVDSLRRLGRAVDWWPQRGEFVAANLDAGGRAWDVAPGEVQTLARSFELATRAILRQEAELGEAIAQQELLTKEIHHRVKNNLQIVASLLNLQAGRIRQPEARAEFQSARDRVRALATLHRHLYAFGELNTINMRPFLQELCEQLFQAMGERAGERLALEIEAPALQISSDQAVPLSLIVMEAVSNAVKYAFPGGRRGHVRVQLVAAEETVTLTVEDDGVGIPKGLAETEAGPRDGIGLQLIRGFARQLGATLLVEEGEGTRYTVRIPLRAVVA